MGKKSNLTLHIFLEDKKQKSSEEEEKEKYPFL